MRCGTNAGNSYHRYHQQNPCQPCREAKRIYDLNLRRSKGVTPKLPPVCGTYSGYAAHYRDNTQPCRTCMDAQTIYMAKWRSRSSRPRRATLRVVIVDVLDVLGETSMQTLVDEVTARFGYKPVSVRRVTYRLVAAGVVFQSGRVGFEPVTFLVA